MSFTSLPFLFFTAAAVAVYYLLPKRFRWGALLAASYVFYAAQGWLCLLYLFIVTATVYVTAAFINRMQENTDRQEKRLSAEGAPREERRRYRVGRKKKEKYLLVACLLVNLCLLAVLKYFNFAIDNLNRIAAFLGKGTQIRYIDVLLPLGISFYMFQSLGYLLDVYWKRTDAQKNFFKFALFVSFFPQIGQGPISRYGNGNCYAYYSLSRLLLTRAGIPSIMVTRYPAVPNHHHWWNLAYVKGGWYHFDTTPRRLRGRFCLLTDGQLAVYERRSPGTFRYQSSKYPKRARTVICGGPF